MQNLPDPYVQCPVYESASFRLRLIKETDAPDLLACYSDPLSAPIFNSDNCTSNFIYQTLPEMQDCVRWWIAQYHDQYYVRFAIVDMKTDKAVGTIEFFARPETFAEYGKVGVLRLDLASPYERQERIAEILGLVEANFYPPFGVQVVITKAIPAAEERIAALKQAGYQALEKNPIMPYADYYLRQH